MQPGMDMAHQERSETLLAVLLAGLGLGGIGR
jgi:hypothetical protein